MNEINDKNDKKPRKIVKVGTTYGAVTVLSICDDSKYRKYLCRCKKCSFVFKATGHQIFVYEKTCCPHCKKESSLEHREESYRAYVNREYGDLVVIGYCGLKPANSRDNNRKVPFMLCECDKCGSETEIPLPRLKQGGAKQCKNCGRKNLSIGRDFTKAASVEGTSIISIDGRAKVNKNSTTGHKGVSYMQKQGSYRAYIYFKHKFYHLGTYPKIEDAISARKEAEENIYGNFLKWYADAYPDKWERIKKRDE